MEDTRILGALVELAESAGTSWFVRAGSFENGVFQGFDPSTPDLVILTDREAGSTLRQLRHLRTQHPRLRILLNEGSDSPYYLLKSIQHGADGWLEWPVTPLEFARAVCEVMSGGHPLPDGIRKIIFTGMRRHSSGADFNKMFTPRENEILAFLLQGCSHKELPDALKVGQGTIHTHITHLRKK